MCNVSKSVYINQEFTHLWKRGRKPGEIPTKTHKDAHHTHYFQPNNWELYMQGGQWLSHLKRHRERQRFLNGVGNRKYISYNAIYQIYSEQMPKNISKSTLGLSQSGNTKQKLLKRTCENSHNPQRGGFQSKNLNLKYKSPARTWTENTYKR